MRTNIKAFGDTAIFKLVQIFGLVYQGYINYAIIKIYLVKEKSNNHLIRYLCSLNNVSLSLRLLVN